MRIQHSSPKGAKAIQEAESSPVPDIRPAAALPLVLKPSELAEDSSLFFINGPILGILQSQEIGLVRIYLGRRKATEREGMSLHRGPSLLKTHDGTTDPSCLFGVSVFLCI